MGKITLRGYILSPTAELDSIREALAIHGSLSREEPGCITFEVTESSTETGRFDIFEEFESPEAFEFHKARNKTSNWAIISKDLKRHFDIDGLPE